MTCSRCRQRASQWRHALHQIPGDEAGSGAAVLQDESEFTPVQLGVDRDRDHAGVPAGKQEFHILWAVLHDQGGAVTRFQFEVLPQTAAHHRDPVQQLAVCLMRIDPNGHCRVIGQRKPGSLQEIRDVHGRLALPPPGLRQTTCCWAIMVRFPSEPSQTEPFAVTPIEALNRMIGGLPDERRSP